MTDMTTDEFIQRVKDLAAVMETTDYNTLRDLRNDCEALCAGTGLSTYDQMFYFLRHNGYEKEVVALAAAMYLLKASSAYARYTLSELACYFNGEHNNQFKKYTQYDSE